jgi:hypothetical protein
MNKYTVSVDIHIREKDYPGLTDADKAKGFVLDNLEAGLKIVRGQGAFLITTVKEHRDE